MTRSRPRPAPRRSGALLTIVIVLGSALLLDLQSRRSADAGDAAPVTAGDANGDGSLDISDAVFILVHLFQGGPAPEELAPCATAQALPSTGQDQCFDCSGNVIDCASSAYPGQDAYYRLGCELTERFVDNADGTITDLCTGLQWQKAPADFDGDTSPDTGRWCQGLRHAEGLELAGHGDWRVPNAQELHSLVAYGQASSWLPEVFEGPAGPYWTSTTDVDDILRAWAVTFAGSPTMTVRTKASEYSYTRAVRSVDSR